jgi:hypothetical protein
MISHKTADNIQITSEKENITRKQITFQITSQMQKTRQKSYQKQSTSPYIMLLFLESQHYKIDSHSTHLPQSNQQKTIDARYH